MSDRWTIERLNQTDDLLFAISILNERRNKLENQYSPLAMKLQAATRTLSDIREREQQEAGNHE